MLFLFIGNEDFNKMNSEKYIIQDKICPNCKVPIYDDNEEFCVCGYSFTRERKLKLWGLVASAWMFIIIFLLLVFNSFSQLSSVVYNKLEKTNSDFYSVSSSSVKIIVHLKNSKYKDYIQTIYVHPKEANKLMVLIKPIYWNMMASVDKESLRKTVMQKWSEIYKKENPHSKLKPVVNLANFG